MNNVKTFVLMAGLLGLFVLVGQLIGGSSVINPLGQIVAKAGTTGDELVVARIDLDQMTPVRKRWNFLGRRQPQHYDILLQPVTEQEPYR